MAQMIGPFLCRAEKSNTGVIAEQRAAALRERNARQLLPLRESVLKALRCEVCDSEWIVRDQDLGVQRICPFCGSGTIQTAFVQPSATLGGSLFTALSREGMEILSMPNELDKVMQQFVPTLKKEIRLFCRNVCEAHPDLLKKALSGENREAVLTALRNMLTDEECLSDAWAKVLCDAIREANALREQPNTELGHVMVTDYASPESIDIPKEMTIRNGVLFNYTGNVKAVWVPNGVKKIGAGAFSDKSVEYVVLPETVEEIGERAFKSCLKLSAVAIPSSLKRIRKYAFAGCNALVEMIFPMSLERIEGFAFHGCYHLSKVLLSTSTVLDESVFFSTNNPTVEYYESKKPRNAGKPRCYTPGTEFDSLFMYDA